MPRDLWRIACWNLWRNRAKTAAILVPLLIVTACLASFTFSRDGMERDATSANNVLPDITVQKMVAGRAERIPLAVMSRVSGLPHVKMVAPRVWGYMPMSVKGQDVAYTLMGIDLERMPIAEQIDLSMEHGRFLRKGVEGECVVGKAIAAMLGVHDGQSITLADSLGNAHRLRVAGVFSIAVQIYSADLILVNLDSARKMFGYRPDEASDLCVYLDHQAYVDTVAERILKSNVNLRVLTKDALGKLTQEAYGSRSGVMQLLWLVLLLTSMLIAYAQASISVLMPGGRLAF